MECVPSQSTHCNTTVLCINLKAICLQIVLPWGKDVKRHIEYFHVRKKNEGSKYLNQGFFDTQCFGKIRHASFEWPTQIHNQYVPIMQFHKEIGSNYKKQWVKA